MKCELILKTCDLLKICQQLVLTAFIIEKISYIPDTVSNITIHIHKLHDCHNYAVQSWL